MLTSSCSAIMPSERTAAGWRARVYNSYRVEAGSDATPCFAGQCSSSGCVMPATRILPCVVEAEPDLRNAGVFLGVDDVG